jgi:hypothetical protein
LKQGDALSPQLSNLALEYAIRRVQVNQDCFKLNGIHQLLAYADDVNILGGSIHTAKKNTEALVAAGKEIGLEVSVGKKNTWSCLVIRMQDEITVLRLIIVPSKGWKISNIWEQV